MNNERLLTFTNAPWWRERLPEKILLRGSEKLCDYLLRSNQSLIFTSRQGSLIGTVSAGIEVCELSLFPTPSPMGVSICGSGLALGCRNSIDVYQALPNPNDLIQTSFIRVSSHRTGAVGVHDVGWVDGGFVFVNTLFSSVCVTRDDCNFEILWTPPFIDKALPIDACHLNGMAMLDGRPRFVTALAESGEREGWRKMGPDSGILMDLDSDFLVRGLSLPHSPLVSGGDIWLLESGRGGLIKIEKNGHKTQILNTSCLVRGLALSGSTAIVGTSQLRSGTATHSKLTGRMRSQAGASLLLADTAQGTISEEVLLPGIEEISSLSLSQHRSISLVPKLEDANYTFICRDGTI